jgi:serine/threonine-protein kinase
MTRYDSAAEDESDELIGTLVAGKYLLTDLVGEGGMGTVYRAVHEGLSKEVAFKVLRPELCASKRAVARFLREAQTVGAVGHPNIVDVYDVGRMDDGRPYMVMEFLRGKDLGLLLEEQKRLAPARVAELLTGPAVALDAMHARGLLHRDIKPENLVVLKRDGVEIVKLVDFGLAAFLDGNSRLTTTGTVCGTPHYMPPEASGGAFPDPRGDVYSLATVAFELIAGRLPFEAAEPMHILAQKLVQDPPRLRDVASTPVPAALEILLERSLSRAPADRPASASQFVKELADAARGSLMVARRTLELPASFSDRPPHMDEETPLGVPLDRKHTSPYSDRPAPTVEDSFGTPVARTRNVESSIQPKITPPAIVDTERVRRPKTPLLAWIGIAAAFVAFAGGAIVILVLSFGSEDPVAVELPERAREADEVVRPAMTTDDGAEHSGSPREEATPGEATIEEPPTRPENVEERPTVRESVRPTMIIALTEAMIETHAMAETPPEEPAMVELAMVEMVEPTANDPVAPDGPAPDSSSAGALTREGNELALRGRLPEAIDRYTQATLRAPRYAPAWRGLGIANERMQRRPEARQAFQRYLDLAPNAPDAERIRARLDGL